MDRHAHSLELSAGQAIEEAREEANGGVDIEAIRSMGPHQLRSRASVAVALLGAVSRAHVDVSGSMRDSARCGLRVRQG